jgi:hypothetical protein
MTSFEAYSGEAYSQFQAKARALVDNSPVALAFELVVLRVMHLLEEQLLALPSDANGEALRLLAIKGVHESRGFLACARDGNMWSAYHHSRALIELLLSSHHLVCMTSKRDKRMTRFREFPNLYTYQYHLRAQQAIAQGELTEDEYERIRLVSPDHVRQLEQKESEWRAIFDLPARKTLLDVTHWHHPSSIADLLREFRSQKLNLRSGIVDLSGVDSTYAHYCHATHVSPSGHRLFTRGLSLPLVSVQADPDRLMQDVVLAAEMFIGALVRWDELLVPNAGLLRRTRQLLEAYRQAVIVNAPAVQL